MRNAPIYLVRMLVLGFVIHGLSAVSAHAAAPDAFLDQPLPRGIKFDRETLPSVDAQMKSIETTSIDFRIETFHDFLRRMAEVTGKKVPWPEGMAMWKEEKGWPALGSLPVDPKGTRREVCDRCAVAFGLIWRYDAARDEISLRPDWRRADPRTGGELVRVLLQEKPVPWQKLRDEPEPGAPDRFNKVPDEWRAAFDALLSLPANYGGAGALRLFDDTHGNRILVPWPERNLFIGLVTENGQRELLLLNGQERMSNKSLASDLTCYFFDEEGRFLGGQILIPAYREMDIRTITLAGPDRVAITVDRGDILYFTLQNHALVLESLVTQNGRKFDAVKTKNCNGWGILSSATKFIATPTSVRMLPPPVGGK